MCSLPTLGGAESRFRTGRLEEFAAESATAIAALHEQTFVDEPPPAPEQVIRHAISARDTTEARTGPVGLLDQVDLLGGRPATSRLGWAVRSFSTHTRLAWPAD
jgi:hypothetical protein